jgi:glycosyltransferase involved in cell wall biosynthesis
MPRKPLVTVLLSAFNDGRFLPEAVESILAQTLADFEFLIVDDGSTDGSADYLRGLNDPRVRLLRNETNIGLTRSLNRGLDAAAGTFVARMDADDVAMPHRLARQVEFLRGRPDVGVVGSSRVLIDERGAVVAAHARAAEDDLRIRWKCLLGNPFAHPTVMLRADVLARHGLRYDASFRTEDYELWTRLLAVTQGANLREPLLRYRLRDGVSSARQAEQLRNHDRISYASIRRLVPGFEIRAEEVTQLRGRFGGYSVREPEMDPKSERWVEKYLALLDAFVAPFPADPEATALRSEVRAAVGAIQGTPPLPSRRG